MPRLQPFTALCRELSRRPALDRADLHLHTTHSDGCHTPAEVVNLALRCGLCAIAITDHDTLDGVEPARLAARGTGLEVVPAVEITAEDGRELHLLAYFVSTDDGPLTEALQRLRQQRGERFLAMVDRLRRHGIAIEADAPPDGSPGRRHLAEMLVRQGKAGSVRESFQRWLRDGGPADVPKTRLSLAEALACVRAAGGVASLAHPPESVTAADLARWQSLGLQAIEAEYPGFRPVRVKALRALATALGLAVSGGSDSHGDNPARTVGARTISRAELEPLRQRVSVQVVRL